MATAPDVRHLPRFGRTERALHWVHASAFFVLLGSGLCLYLPGLAQLVGRRPLNPALPVPRRVRRPLLANVHSVFPWARPPVFAAGNPVAPPLAERDHPRLGARGLGVEAPREVGAGARGARRLTPRGSFRRT